MTGRCRLLQGRSSTKPRLQKYLRPLTWIQNKTWYTQDAGGNIIHPAGTNWMDVANLNFDNSLMRLEMINGMNGIDSKLISMNKN